MNRYSLSVLGAGFFWGFIGIFTRHLEAAGIGSNGAIILRCGISAVCFAILILCTGAKQFRVKIKDLWCFLGSGLLSLLFFTFCYFNAINMMSLSVAAVLLYTAPTIVMLLSLLLFKEKITVPKIIAVVLAFVGCGLVSGITGGAALTGKGLLFGFGSGIGYALYTIFSRYALQRGYSSSTINLYSCVLASLGALLIWGPGDTFRILVSTPSVIPWSIGLGGLCCFVPYMLYTYGLTGTENGKASVLASIEPVVASLVGVFFYHETMTIPTLIGVLLVLSAVVLLNLSGKSRAKRQ